MRNLFTTYEKRFFFVFLILCLNLNIIKADYTFSANGKSYKIVETKKSWTDAASYASNSGGYLVEIGSQTEQNVIWDAIVNGAKIDKNYVSVSDGGSASFIWIGANDIATEGTWIWDGDNSGSGVNFWKGQGTNGNNDGQIINGCYNNWGGLQQHGNSQEPDNYMNNQDAAAIGVEPWPRNNGILGQGGEWNDLNVNDQIYFIIEYDYSGKPAKPTTPTGSTSVCQGTPSTQYQTTETTDAKTYVWVVTPDNAGSISGDKTGTMVWNSNFSGTAEITVYGVNPLGNGTSSDKITITVKPKADMNEKPSGTDHLCMNPNNTTYTINGVTLATSYNWIISPASAGQIIGSGKTISVDWTDTYSGDAVIKVFGVNDCGIGANPDSLKVNISRIPDKPQIPQGKTSIYQNDLDADYFVVQVPLATNYVWEIAPKEAGLLKSNNNSVTVNWDDNFAGEVQISVKSENPCGQSISSEPLIIIVSDKPAKAAAPTGISSLCQGTDSSNYQTEDCIGAISYEWKLSPANAGTIIGTSKNGKVAWNKKFYGEATISVAGVGNLAKGDFSDILSVNIDPLPFHCDKPTGENVICSNNQNELEYLINPIENAKMYEWRLIPESAGTIKGNGSKATFKVSNSYVGNLTISARGINDCGTGEFSDSLIVFVEDRPAKPDKPSGYTLLTKGTKNTKFTAENAEDAQSYIWNLSPTSSGTIIESDKICRIDWADNFIGIAYLQVKSVNNCGESEFSENLSIELKDSVVSVNNTGTNEFKISPNPVRDNFRINNLDISNSNILSEISIVDIFGKTIKQFEGNLLLSTNSIIVSTKELSSGVYYCIVRYNNQIKMIKFVVIK